MTTTSTDRRSGAFLQAAIKLPCRVVATTNLDLDGLETIDGVALAADDRVLVTGQTDTTENGIYVADTGEWARSSDCNGSRDLVQGTIVAVVAGTAYTGSVWQVTTASPAVGSALAWEFMGASALSVATAFMLTLLDDPDAATARATLGAAGLTGNETIAGNKTLSGTTTFSGAANFDAAVDFDSTVDMTGATVTVPTVAATDSDTSAASTKFVHDFLASTGAIYGLTYSNNAADATNDIDIAAGGCADATKARWLTFSALTKRLDAAWAVGTNQGGLDTGAVGNSDYYIWGIERSDTGVTDVLFSLSSTAPTMPASYDYKRLIGWFKRSGGAISLFSTLEMAGGGIELRWTQPTLDVDLANTLTTSQRTDAVKVPLNFATWALVRVLLLDAATGFFANVTSPDEFDAAPSGTVAPLANFSVVAAVQSVADMRIRTSATGTIAARATLATVDAYRVATLGFQWARR
jgi:hypothetical protein